MNGIGKIAGAALFLASVAAHAGFYGNTAHSRGNCMGFNEHFRHSLPHIIK